MIVLGGLDLVEGEFRVAVDRTPQLDHVGEDLVGLHHLCHLDLLGRVAGTSPPSKVRTSP